MKIDYLAPSFAENDRFIKCPKRGRSLNSALFHLLIACRTIKLSPHMLGGSLAWLGVYVVEQSVRLFDRKMSFRYG